MTFLPISSFGAHLRSVVVVHGLDPLNNPDHAFTTWTTGDVLWLRDLLPKNPRTPQIRVLLYGYNSSAVFGASTAGVSGASRNLLDELRIKRQVFPTYVEAY